MNKNRAEIEKFAFGIGLLRKLIVDGKKGDMERIVKNFEDKLKELLEKENLK